MAPCYKVDIRNSYRSRVDKQKNVWKIEVTYSCNFFDISDFLTCPDIGTSWCHSGITEHMYNMGSFSNPHISKCSIMPKWHQFVPMSWDVGGSETVKTLQLYATSRCTSVSTRLMVYQNWMTSSLKKPVPYEKGVTSLQIKNDVLTKQDGTGRNRVRPRQI